MDFEPINLTDMRVVITGGTTGIGRATAVRLAHEGCRMLIFGRHEQELNDALEDVRRVGKGEVHGVVADQSSHDDVLRVFQQVDEKLGGLEILINNAALADVDYMKTGYEDWKYVLDSNLMGYLDCAREAIERMSASGEGHIVNVGSLSAEELEPSVIYSVSKAGNRAFSESLRKLVNEEKKIKVSLVEPGLVGTNLADDNPDIEKQRQEQEKGKMLKAEDIAEAIYYTLIQPWRCDVISLQIRPRFQMI